MQYRDLRARLSSMIIFFDLGDRFPLTWYQLFEIYQSLYYIISYGFQRSGCPICTV